MRGKTDINNVVLQGKIVKAKAWDPKPGKNFTNGSVTLRVGETDVPLTVFLSITQKGDDRKGFERTFQQGASVCVSKAQFSSYTKKDKESGKDTEVFQVEAKLNGSYQVAEEGAFASSVVASGLVKIAKGDRAMIESAYFAGGPDGRTGEIKHRKFKVLAPGRNLEEMLDKHVTIFGEIASSDNGPYVKATTVVLATE